MGCVRLLPEDSALVVVDLQPRFLSGIHEAERVATRCSFLVRAAKLLGVPVLATEQNPGSMGSTCTSLSAYFTQPAFPKLSFSSAQCPEFMEALNLLGRGQVVIIGIETHICVSLTASDLHDQGFDVVVCPDAVSARSLERHKLGMERIRDAGAAPAHTEAVAYEWMGTAAHGHFREMLALVKEHL